MYDEPQISCEGKWGDAIIKKDNKGKPYYCCQYCGKNKWKLESIKEHLTVCKNSINYNNESVSFVICKICNFHSKKLGSHLKNIHKITVKNYTKKYNSLIICKESSDNYSKSSQENGNWIVKAKESGVDLTEYWAKVSSGVKGAIDNNPDEIVRRSELMLKINNTILIDPYYRKIMSDTAKATSARPDIIEKRSAQLQRWRDEFPADFYEKCTKNLINWTENNPEKISEIHKSFISSYESHPEKVLFDFVSTLNGFNFKRNQFIKSSLFTTKTNKKQTDILDVNNKICIEFDGPTHFEPIFGEEKLSYAKVRDNQLETYVNENNYLLIRVGHDTYINKAKKENSYFLQHYLDKIVKILNNKIPGVYKIGDVYNNG